MSSSTLFICIDNFVLRGGRVVATQKASSDSASTRDVQHVLYNTTMSFAGNSAIPAELRIYGGYNPTVYPEETVALGVVHVYLPPSGPAFLEAISLYPYPGHPSEPDYGTRALEISEPLFFGVGQSRTTNLAERAPDGHSRAFTLEVGAYVRDSRQASTVQCYYPHDTKRWAKTPLPTYPRIPVVFGSCKGISWLPGRALSVRVDSIAIDVTPTREGPVAAPAPSSGSSAPQTPAKRRRWELDPTDSMDTSPGMSTPQSSRLQRRWDMPVTVGANTQVTSPSSSWSPTVNTASVGPSQTAFSGPPLARPQFLAPTAPGPSAMVAPTVGIQMPQDLYTAPTYTYNTVQSSSVPPTTASVPFQTSPQFSRDIFMTSSPMVSPEHTGTSTMTQYATAASASGVPTFGGRLSPVTPSPPIGIGRTPTAVSSDSVSAGPSTSGRPKRASKGKGRGKP